LGSKLLAPAFVNAHTHLAMIAFRGIGGLESLRGNVIEDLYFRLEKDLTPEDVYAFSRVGAQEVLLSGTAAVYDHYYGGSALANALLDAGLSGVVAPTLQDLAGPGVLALDEQLAATLSIHSDASFAARGVFAALGPHATDTVSDALWRTLSDLAEQHALPLHFHVAQSFEEVERNRDRFGASPLGRLARLGVLGARARLLLVHGVFAAEEDLALLDASKHTLVACPSSQAEYCFPADWRRWQRARLPWATGTDCATSNDAMDVQRELRVLSGMPMFSVTASENYAAWMEQHGGQDLGPLQAARNETFNSLAGVRLPETLLASVWSAAGAWHPRAQVGRIAPGLLANLLVLDLEHPALWPATDVLRGLTMSDVAPAVHALMVAGRFRGTPGDFQRSLLAEPEYLEVRAEATARLHAHLARVGL
jgi:5-methylthioadenosine/S-adenosylhomocysteine deaminase